MDEKLYRPEPIPRRPQQAASVRPSRTPMNGSRPDAREAIARIMADERFSSSVRTAAQNGARPYKAENLFSSFSSRQPFDLPDRYREMRAISRWQEGVGGKPGRWLTEAELFYRQGTFMANWEDDCPYAGLFKSYFPTYNAMSDRQLRGYFTWRAAVRAGDIQETSLSFAYVYLYELINGIGIADPLDGFRKIEAFWQAYRAFAAELDRYVNVWLQDYAVYHGLDQELLAPYRTLAFDRALIALRRADAMMTVIAPSATGRRKRGESAIPLPPDNAHEEQLFQAIDALSSYRLSNSRLYKEHACAMRHVACAVYVRMSEHHRKQRKSSLLESWFGEQVSLPYTMFGSAVFFEPTRHADIVYELDEIHRYRCEHGLWTCERFHGSRSRSPKLGAAMRAVDGSLRKVLDPEHLLKDDGKTPKYLQKFIDQEVEAWTAWSATHAPIHIDIDLSQLAGIRSGAAQTREALLIDEEREGYDGRLPSAGHDDGRLPLAENTGKQLPPAGNAPVKPACAALGQQRGNSDTFFELSNPLKRMHLSPLLDGELNEESGHADDVEHATEAAGAAGMGNAADIGRAPAAVYPPDAGALSSGQAAYLRALANGNAQAAHDAAQATGTSEDLLVDAINEALFDQIGDTVIEYGPDGPELIEDYREDVEGILNHE